MEFALAGGSLTRAVPNGRATCPHCGASVIAKCGSQKVWHWSHLGERHCDVWWEPETQWHREWKEQFPPEWQERTAVDEYGERHVADVRTPHGLILEFQHSPITRAERVARTAFYKEIVWVIDGLRHPAHLRDFGVSIRNWKRWPSKIFFYDIAEWTFPKEWINSPVPVVLDFGPNENLPKGIGDSFKHWLWCLLPPHHQAPRLIIPVDKVEFIRRSLVGHPFPAWETFSDQFVADREAERQQKIRAPGMKFWPSIIDHPMLDHRR